MVNLSEKIKVIYANPNIFMVLIYYPLNEQWARLAVYGKRAPLQRKLRGQHRLTRKAKPV